MWLLIAWLEPQQLLESKDTLTLGQLFKIVPVLKQYVVVKLAPRKKYIIAIRPNLIIALMAINPHVIVIQV